jgi:hypothetical protein
MAVAIIPTDLAVTRRLRVVAMVGEGRPSMSFLGAITQVVDGGPSPAMTGKAEPKSQPFRLLV